MMAEKNENSVTMTNTELAQAKESLANAQALLEQAREKLRNEPIEDIPTIHALGVRIDGVEIAKADKAEVNEAVARLEADIATKVSAEDCAETVAQIEANIATKADKGETETALATKAEQEAVGDLERELEALSAELATKASKSDLDDKASVAGFNEWLESRARTLDHRINVVANTTNGKADKTSVDALEQVVATKADQTSVDALEAKVETKATREDVDALAQRNYCVKVSLIRWFYPLHFKLIGEETGTVYHDAGDLELLKYGKLGVNDPLEVSSLVTLNIHEPFYCEYSASPEQHAHLTKFKIYDTLPNDDLNIGRECENFDTVRTQTIAKSCSIIISNISCLSSATQIAMADGTTKRVCDLRNGEQVLSLNPETMETEADTVCCCDGGSEKKWHEKDVWEFDDGTKLETVHPHQFFNVRLNRMEYIGLFRVGEDRVRKIDGTTPLLISHTIVKEETRHNTLFTERFNNYFANGILSGNRSSKAWGWHDAIAKPEGGFKHEMEDFARELDGYRIEDGIVKPVYRDENSANVPRKEAPRNFSKLKAVMVLTKMGLWTQVKAWIDAAGLTDLYLAATDFKEDNEFFVQGLTTLKAQLNLDDAQVEALLAQCVAEG